MRLYSALLLLIANLFSGAVYAQNWVVFVPFERDFRVLFPEPPQRTVEPDGTAVFRSAYDNGDNSAVFVVHRLPPTFRPDMNARGTIQQRLQARLRDDDNLRYPREENDGPEWDRHVFRYRYSVSVHRLVENRGRYYELEVILPRERVQVAMHTARDFFESFQMTGISLPSIGITIGQRLDAWCQSRTDPFSRAFCEYSVCLRSGHDKYPHCNSLFRR
jgi:hypothetical protein